MQPASLLSPLESLTKSHDYFTKTRTCMTAFEQSQTQETVAAYKAAAIEAGHAFQKAKNSVNHKLLTEKITAMQITLKVILQQLSDIAAANDLSTSYKERSVLIKHAWTDLNSQCHQINDLAKKFQATNSERAVITELHPLLPRDKITRYT